MASKEYIGLTRITEIFTLFKNKLLTIKNQSNTAMTKRYILQFKDAKITDDSAGGATKVEVVSELQSESDFDNLPTDGTADGSYVFPNSGEEYLTADNVGYDANTSVKEAIDAVEGQIVNSSDAYSASKDYAVGDYCIYNNTLYRCITACTAASWSVNSGCFVVDTVIGAIDRTSFYRLIPNGTKIRVLGIGSYRGDASACVMDISLPVPASMLSSITCDLFRQTFVSSPVDNNPTIEIVNNFQIRVTSFVSFSGYVGKEFCADLVFTYK